MPRINRDVVVAIVLLAVIAAFYAASFDIRETSYGTMQSHVWPRILLAGLAVCCLIYLFQSVRAGVSPPAGAAEGERRGLGGWLDTYRNAIVCFALFLGFLLTMEWIGMLLGGILFIFLALTAMGPGGTRNLAIHALVAVVSMGAMWSIFTFAIGVILPEGEWFVPS